MSSLQLLLELAEELDKLKLQESQQRQNNLMQAYPHLKQRSNHPALHYHFILPEESQILDHQYPICRHRKHLLKQKSIDDGLTKIGKEGFQISMDVGQFLPNELSVKVIDKFIVIEGKHEERQDDYGYISRHFIRKYPIPDEYDANQTLSSLSSDGILTVSIPKPKSEGNTSNERVIQIQQTGPAHLSVKENPAEKNDVDETEVKNESGENGENGSE